MKKKLLILITVLCLSLIPTFSQAYNLITDNSNFQGKTYQCYGPSTKCQACHLGMSDDLYNFNNKTTWHTNHQIYATDLANGCSTCHDSSLPPNGCSMAPVPTIKCETCHNPNPPAYTPSITPVQLPCDWVDYHNLNKYVPLGTTCATGSCHANCSTVIELYSFTASAGNQKVILEWKTASEIDNAGFNIYRSTSEGGEYVKITDSLISVKGSAMQSTPYTFVDENVRNRITYYYKLEDVDLNGVKTMHGPVSATPRWIFGIFGK